MASSSILPLVGRLAVLFVGAAGAQLAWRAEYMATLAVCLAVVVWALARIVAEALEHRDGPSDAEDRTWSALLDREREARRLTAFLDHAPVPLLAMRSRGALSAINLSARRVFQTDDVLIDPSPDLVSAVLGAVPGVRQTLSLNLTGAPRAYALTVAEVVSDGDFVRIVALVDIQAEVQAAEAAALRDLMQVLSHEIMNSLTPVTSMAQSVEGLLRGIGSADPAVEQAREAAASMARRSEGLMRFVEAYRELARMPEPCPAPVDVADLTDDLARLFRSRWGTAVALETDVEAMPPIALDRDLVLHAMLNILTNAAEAAVSNLRPSVALRASRTLDGRLMLAVSDNGDGIPTADPSLVLRPFFTTKPGGSGIGLSVARQVAQAHGGDVQIENVGDGARVTLAI